MLTQSAVEAARVLELAIWDVSTLGARTVVRFRGGQPVGLMGDITIPAGWVPVYGMTPKRAAWAAAEHARRVRQEVGELDAYRSAMAELADCLEVGWHEVQDVTARYVESLVAAEGDA